MKKSSSQTCSLETPASWSNFDLLVSQWATLTDTQQQFINGLEGLLTQLVSSDTDTARIRT
ncbi:12857_t:CDS:2, partial [Dentiscutata heterogama]